MAVASEVIGKLQPLLKDMLVRLRRHQDTPLMGDVDCLQIAQAVIPLASLQDPESVKNALDRLIDRALGSRGNGDRGSGIKNGEKESKEGGSIRDSDPPTPDLIRDSLVITQSTVHPLGNWLENVHTVISRVHHQALDILGLRLEGFQEREIALRLGLGLRLVQRLLDDMRLAWQASERKE